MNEAVEGFIASWLATEPEGRFVGNFLSPALRTIYFQFSALVSQLEEAALRIAEPTVAAAKLAWWEEELQRAQQGTARHPLMIALARAHPSAPFAALAPALPELHRFESAANEAALYAGIAAWTATQSALLAALTLSEANAWPPWWLQRQCLLRRLRELDTQVRLGRLWVPLELMAGEQIARHQLVDEGRGDALARARRSMARRLLARCVERRELHAMAMLQGTLIELRLERMALHGQDELPLLRALWRSWRAARTSRLN